MDETTAAMPVDSWGELCLFLKGSPNSFTGMLLTLLAKSEPGNRARLRRAFPRHVAAWEIWVVRAPQLTYGELEEALAGRGLDDAPEAAIEKRLGELRAALLESAQDANVSRDVMTYRAGLAAGVAHAALAGIDAALALAAEWDGVMAAVHQGCPQSAELRDAVATGIGARR